MEQLLLALPSQTCYTSIFACITCNKPLQSAVFESAAWPNFGFIAAPLLLLLLVSFILASVALKAQRRKSHFKATITATVIIGMGIGGFIDGIVLHQILQWHEMLSNQLPPNTLLNKSVNMFWDGIFHAVTLVITISGIYVLWNVSREGAVPKSNRTLTGGLFLGWAIFNILEGIADHHILKLHNVREISRNVTGWNYGFIAFSIFLLLLSLYLIKQKRNN